MEPAPATCLNPEAASPPATRVSSRWFRVKAKVAVAPMKIITATMVTDQISALVNIYVVGSLDHLTVGGNTTPSISLIRTCS